MIGSLETIRNIIKLNKLSEFKSLISGSDKEEILRLCNIAYGQMSHLEFMRQCWGRKRDMLVGIHTWYICKKIDIAFEKFRKGESSFLINLLCFRHGKSEITTRFLPPHFLAEFPDREVIVTSHSTKNTNKFSRFGRNLIKSAKFKQLYPDIDISKENAGIEEWGIEGTEGLAQYFGILSGSSGTGAGCLVTDDFFGGREDAESPIIREKVHEAYTDNIFTRRDDPSINLITVTPWHPDDLVARIIRSMRNEKKATKYDVIRLPYKDPDEETVNEISELLKTEDDEELRENMKVELEKYANGGYLFPAKYSDQWYIDMEKALGGATGYGTQSLMRANPQDKGGKRFKTENAKILTLEEFEEKTAGLRFVRAWDLASTVKQTKKTDPDYTVGVKIAVRFLTANVRGMYRAQVFVADVVRGRWLAPRRKDVIVDTAINDGLIKQGIETFGQYVDAYNELKSILRGIRVVMPIRMPKDKDSKSAPLETVFEDGEFYLLEAPWNKKYLDEFKEESSHDDQIDGTAVGYHMHKPVQVGFQYEESLVL